MKCQCPFEVVEHWIIVGDENSDDCRISVFPTICGGWSPGLYEGDFDVEEMCKEWKFGIVDVEEYPHDGLQTWYDDELRNLPDGTIIHTSIHTGDYYKNDDGTFEWDPCGKHKGWKSWKKENGKWVIL